MNHRKILSLALALATTIAAWGQSNAVQKAAKSVFTLTTYKEDGSILAVTHGSYFVNAGEGIAAFKPFVGAYRASIIDAAGISAEVVAIAGANDMYDICRFRLSKASGTPLQPYQGVATGTAWAAAYSTKKAELTPLTINSSEKFLDKYNYYIFNEEITEELEGCPILTETGEVIGLVQQSGTSYAIHSTDARYYSDLSSSGLSSFDAVLQQTHIRPDLPTDREQARLMLLTINDTTDSMTVVNTTNDYIAHYPDDVDGYTAMATYEVQHKNIQRASEVMDTAIKKVKSKDEAYYDYAKLIYNTLLFGDETSENTWTIDDAEKNINKAISTNNSPLYRHLLAQILFTKGDYTRAQEIFEQLTTTEIANSDIYYEIAQCKNALGASQEDILADLNKAVEIAPQPLSAVSAPYVLVRGMLLDDMEEYRQALADYNLYDSLMSYNAAATFYYTRAKCEVNVRQYQQAINDFAHAIMLNSQEATYMAELAALQLRVGQYDNALMMCEMCLQLTTEYPDIYVVQGLTLHQLDRDPEALEAWRKASALGDERGDMYIEKYGLK